jgi:hypothetical protein
MKCSRYFGAKWRGFIKSESILVPKGASHFKTQNIRCDNLTKSSLLSLGRSNLKCFGTI